MRTIKVGTNEDGLRLTKLLGKYLRSAPDSFLYRMLRKKNILLNGKRATGKESVSVGDEIRLYLSEDTVIRFGGPSDQPTANKAELPEGFAEHIIYEDEHILIYDKPAGMLSQKGNPSDVSLVDLITQYLKESGSLTPSQEMTFKPGIVSRLDRNTSGIVVAGKSLYALRELNDLTRTHRLQKFYMAVTEGVVTEESLLDGFWTKDSRSNRVLITDTPQEGSSRVLTSVKPLGHGTDEQTGKAVSCVRIELLTGKGHQIRAHLASVGHPLIGDTKYGALKSSFRFGQLLHAYQIVFPDNIKESSCLRDVNGKLFEAELPEDFRNTLSYYHIKVM